MNKKEIRNKVQDLTGIKDISIKSRKRDYVNARCIYYKLCKEMNPRDSYESISNEIKQDHSTVVHSINNIFPQLEIYDKDFYSVYKKIKSGITDVKDYKKIDSRLHDIIVIYNDLDLHRKEMFVLRATETIKMIKKNKWN